MENLDLFGEPLKISPPPIDSEPETPPTTDNPIPDTGENPEQLSLLDLEELRKWKAEWQDMPEFIQEDLTSEFSIIVHFKNRIDRDAFSGAIGQKITYDTRSIWFPKAEIGSYINKLFIDEEGGSREA